MSFSEKLELMAEILKKSLADPLNESKVFNKPKEKRPQI
jgi:hypothetical protein